MLQASIEFLSKEGFQIFLSVVLGGAIGLEREFRGKPAGLRTNILICMGATLFMIISSKVAQMGGQNFDPGRISAQVVTGIGFLGGGSIMQSGLTVHGLTTAATIWVVGAIGLAIGSSHFSIAIGTSVILLIVLVALRWVESFLSPKADK